MTINISANLRLQVVKHLANGKSLDFTAAATNLSREAVLEVGSQHGYPKVDRLQWAVDVLEKKAREAADASAITEGSAFPTERQKAAQAMLERSGGQINAPRPAAPTAPPVTVKAPSTLEDLIERGKVHVAARVQRQAAKVEAEIDKLRAAIREDEHKNAEKRKAAAAKAKLKAEVEELERQLREKKAALRTPSSKPVAPKPSPAAASTPAAGEHGHRTASLDALRNELKARLKRLGVESRDVRAWAHEHGVECPTNGMLPMRVVEAYEKAVA